MSTQSISPASASAHFAVAVTPSYFPEPLHLQNLQYPAWPTAAASAAVPAVGPVPAYNAVYPMPQVQQQLFQKDTTLITPEALATVKAAIVNSEKDKKVDATKKAVP